MATSNNIGICKLCSREDILLTFHHLIPRTLHKKKWYQKHHTVEELNQGEELCADCHEAIHDFITEKDLGKSYNTLGLLIEHPKVVKFVGWVRKQKKARIKSKRYKGR